MPEDLITEQNVQTNQETTQTTGGNSYDFMSALSPEIRDNPSITKFGGNVDKLAQSYLSLERLMGQGRVVIPKDENDAAGWAAYDKAFGVPETPDKYNLNMNGHNVNIDDFKALMRENHISSPVAQKLLDAYLKDFDDLNDYLIKKAEQDMETAQSELKKDWGVKYTENIKKANATLHKLAGDDFEYFNQKIGNDPKFIKLLAIIGESMSEGSLGGFEGQVSGFNKTPAEAKAEFDKILNDPNDAYWAGSRNRRDNAAWCRANNASFVSEEERKARVAYVNSLLQMAG